MSNEIHIALLKSILEKTEDNSRGLSEVREVMAENTASLKEHMRRTELAEKRLEVHDERIKPLERSQHMWAGVNKALVILGALGGLVGAAFKIFG